MKRNDLLRFILKNKMLYRFFNQFKWFRNFVIKRAREIVDKLGTRED